MEVAGPRLRIDAVLGIPLLRVSMPTFTGGRRAVKGSSTGWARRSC